MAVGKQGSKDVTITYDDAPAGTPRVITNFIMEMGGAKIVVETEESHAFGDAWKEHTRNGMRNCPDIALSGFFDTTTVTGPHVTLRPLDADADPNGGTRTFVAVFGDSKTFTVETLLVEYEALGQNGKLTKFNALIRPTGAGVWT